MSYIGLAPGVSSQRMEDTFTATAGQTSFVPSSGYVPGNIDVYRNGVKLANGLEFTASNGITVVLNNACAAGDSVVLLSYIPRGLSDGYTKPEADNRYFAQSSSMGFRNRIINGDMRIDQRNNGGSVTVGSGSTAGAYVAYAVDRIVAQSVSTAAGDGAAFTAQRNQGSVTPPPGFTNYLGITVTSTQAALDTNSVYRFIHRIEGLNCADMAWGSANAANATISFWVRSSVTGTFGGSVTNGNGGVGAWRVYPFTFVINSANTWEYKTITIPGDTSGTWRTNNEFGVEVSITFGVSSNWAHTPGVWGSSEGYGAAGTVNLMATNGATFQITGWQFEKGSSATPFEFRSYGQELALCQRYYENGKLLLVPTVANIAQSRSYAVTKRTVPTLTLTYGGGSGGTISSASSTDMFYQDANHSVWSVASWNASAEL